MSSHRSRQHRGFFNKRGVPVSVVAEDEEVSEYDEGYHEMSEGKSMINQLLHAMSDMQLIQKRQEEERMKREEERMMEESQREEERRIEEVKREEDRIKTRKFWIRATIACVCIPILLQLIYTAIVPSSFRYCSSDDQRCIQTRNRIMMAEASQIIIHEQTSRGLFKLRMMFFFNKDLVDFPEYDNRRLFHLAACFGNQPASQLLRRWGATVSIIDDFKKTVTQEANEEHCRENREKRDSLAGGDLKATLFMWHCHDEDINAILDALNENPRLLSSYDYDHRQCLHLLAKYNYVSIMKRLLERYSDKVVFVKDRHGKTAIDVAEEKEYYEMAELLKSVNQ